LPDCVCGSLASQLFALHPAAVERQQARAEVARLEALWQRSSACQ
jgi:hypothetical protein